MSTLDSFSLIGVNHEREAGNCQDYSLALKTDNGWSLAVSDGCSSGPCSDLGARALVWEWLNVREFDPKLTAMNALTRCSSLNPKHMLATLVSAHNKEDGFVGKIMGDGAIMWKAEDGVHCVQLKWTGNAPSYPIYLTDEENKAAFLQMTNEPVMVKFDSSSADGKMTQTSVTALDKREILENGLTVTFDKVIWVSVLTDGFAEMFNKDGSLLNVEEALTELSSFKSFEGAFARRRVLRAMKNGHGFYDDISMAIAYIGE